MVEKIMSKNGGGAAFSSPLGEGKDEVTKNAPHCCRAFQYNIDSYLFSISFIKFLAMSVLSKKPVNSFAPTPIERTGIGTAVCE